MDINLERLRCLIYADWPWSVAARCLNKDVTPEGNISVKLLSANPFTLQLKGFALYRNPLAAQKALRAFTPGTGAMCTAV